MVRLMSFSDGISSSSILLKYPSNMSLSFREIWCGLSFACGILWWYGVFRDFYSNSERRVSSWSLALPMCRRLIFCKNIFCKRMHCKKCPSFLGVVNHHKSFPWYFAFCSFFLLDFLSPGILFSKAILHGSWLSIILENTSSLDSPHPRRHNVMTSWSGQVWGHTPEQRVAASTLWRYFFVLRLAIAQTDARPVMPISFR